MGRANEHRQVGWLYLLEQTCDQEFAGDGGTLETSTGSGRSSKQLPHRQSPGDDIPAHQQALPPPIYSYLYINMLLAACNRYEQCACEPARQQKPELCGLLQTCVPDVYKMHLEYFSSYTKHCHLKQTIHCPLKKSANSASWPANARRRCCCDETHLNTTFVSVDARSMPQHPPRSSSTL